MNISILYHIIQDVSLGFEASALNQQVEKKEENAQTILFIEYSTILHLQLCIYLQLSFVCHSYNSYTKADSETFS